MNRRGFLRAAALAAASGLSGLRFAEAATSSSSSENYDAVVVGAGLGGLCCAAHLARAGHRTLLLEQHYRLGGYATSFARRDGNGREFACEVSLHASALDTPNTRPMLEALGLWDRIGLAAHPHAWASRFPGFPLDVPAKTGLGGFERQLAALFPGEAEGLGRYFALWRAVMDETARLGGDGRDFPRRFPHLWAIRDKTVAQVLEPFVQSPRLRAVLTQSCGYYGLPPSRLSAFYYLVPTGQYLESGGYYVRGTSQALSDALGDVIATAGGEVRLRTRVASILTRNGRAVGVRTADGRDAYARAVALNACAPAAFDGLLLPGGAADGERQKMARLDPSPGSVIVWLGLDRDVTEVLGEPELSVYPSLDMEANYAAAMACDFEKASFSMMLYDNLVPGFSPPGCSTVCLVCLCGYEHWRPFEADYLSGRKAAYVAEKRRLADILIRRAEEAVLPGLSARIVMRDAATPLTNRRFTGNARGAIYGFAPTPDNAFLSRLPNATTVPGLFLASAWGSPGGGYTGALMAGRQAYQAMGEILA
ncbi:NAD(P)/FAD-dependent oxidoreductase [Solidesulfovibrio sp.]|uniref:phytoene desaturase family protein n=1 Tax=Solidesulfovibrio sp. TaxID=2910990 RepID=UPI00262F9980|nr:NAD(P)/FAD-dependent oxidoreductase [Solidesulfovibrio sp.]